MTMSTDFDAARLTVLLDIRHPLAYLALHPTLELADSLHVDINWLPLTTPTLKPPSAAAPDDDRGVRHRRYRAEALGREIEAYGAAQGLVLRDYYRAGNADAATLGWLWVRRVHRRELQKYLVELFRAYWSLEIDPEDTAEIEGLIDGLGLDATAFSDWAREAGPAAAEAIASEIRERGLFQVPAYVIEDEVFYGRQHLPMIEWILNGRAGATPI
jgi:2-hydroxychromene-2-carboxylate isomerase